MAIYVDQLFRTPAQGEAAYKVGQKHNHEWCHMYAFPVTEENLTALHKLAQSIGLKRLWFQEGKNVSIPHYDIVPTKRAIAIRRGAIEIERKESVEHFRQYRYAMRPASAIDGFYNNAAALREIVLPLLPPGAIVTTPTPRTPDRLAGKPIPLYWELKIENEGKQYEAQVNAYELAIAVSQTKLEQFAAAIVNEAVREIYNLM